MDIEGAELKALKGAEHIIDRDHPHILIEIHPRMLEARFGGSAEAVAEVFRSRGYRMFEVRGDRLEEVADIDAGVPWRDYFFVHPERAADLPDGVFKARMAA